MPHFQIDSLGSPRLSEHTAYQSPPVDGRTLFSGLFYNQQKIKLYLIVSHWLLIIYVWNFTSARLSITFTGSRFCGYLTVKHNCRRACSVLYNYCFEDLHYNFYKVISSSIFYTGLTYYEAFLQLLRGDYGNISNRVVEPVELMSPPHYKASSTQVPLSGLSYYKASLPASLRDWW